MPALIGLVFYGTVIGFSLYGYIHNIVSIVHNHSVVDFMLILRCVGIAMAPLGTILGYF